MTIPYGTRRRDLERRLAALPTPEPPADLLARIRADLPAAPVAANSGADTSPSRRRPLISSTALRIAAALGVVAVGLSIATRIVRDADRASSAAPSSAPSTASASRATEIAAKRGVAESRPLEEAAGAAHGESPVAGAPSPELVAPAGRPQARQTPSPAESPAALGPLAPGQQALAPHADDSSADSTVVAESAPIRERAELRDRDSVAGGQSRATPSGEASAPSTTADAVRSLAGSLKAEARPRTDRLVRRAEAETSAGPGRPSRESAPSTGGTAEPLDQLVGDMYFRGPGTNPFVDTQEDRLSTFALDVDTGSWTLARAYLDRGALPPSEAIRVEELVNAQPYDDPAPRRGDFTLVGEGAPSPFAPPGDYRLLRFAVKGRELALAERKPAILTFVVDISGSMDRENRLGLVRRSLDLLLDELRPDDRVALVVYGSRGRVLLRHTRDHEAIREAIDALRPEGSTNAEEGLRLAYDLAGEAFRPGASNRLILCSDGVANVGATGPESILERIGREARRGIELTTVGFGMGNYNDALMEQLADQGDGRYHYVDDLGEARRIFVDELAGTLETIARDAKAQVEFDPAVVERWRLVGYENREVADRDFRNDAVDAGELGAGHSAVALYEIRLAPRARRNDRLATLRLRWQSTATGRIEEASLDLRVRDLEGSFRGASPNLRRAAIAAELGELLKGSYYAREATWSELQDEAHRLDRDLAGHRALRKLSDLTDTIDRAARLAGPDRRRETGDE